MQRAADKCLKAVIDVKQVCRKQGTALVDKFGIESTTNYVKRLSSGNRGRHSSNSV